MCWSDFKSFSVKFYISALVSVIIKVILQNAQCNNKDNVPHGSNKTNLYSFEIIIIEWLIPRNILNSNFNTINIGVSFL